MTNAPTIIYLVRHGESEHNVSAVISGHGNPPLTAKGIEQVHETKRRLQHVTFHEVYSSDLERAAKTAEIVAGKPVESHRQLERLREKNYGSLEGKPNEELKPDQHMRRTLPKSESWHYKHVPDMESDREMADRLLNELEKIAKRHAGQTVLVGSHGSAIRVIVQHLEDKHYNDMPPQIKNGGHVKLRYQNAKFVIEETGGYN